MRKPIGFSTLMPALLACMLGAQAQMVKVNLHIVLVDKDLNQKPVPSFRVNLQPTDGSGAEAIELKTALDGTCEKVVPAGKYQLTSAQPIDFQGKRYVWALEVTNKVRFPWARARSSSLGKRRRASPSIIRWSGFQCPPSRCTTSPSDPRRSCGA